MLKPGRLWEVVQGDCSVDLRLGDLEWAMRVDDNVRLCVVFIGYEAGGTKKIGGTGFLVLLGQSQIVVTAQHNLNRVRHAAPGAGVDVWVNAGDGPHIIRTRVDEWLTHPDDPCVDVAVLPRAIPWHRFSHLPIALSMFASDEYLAKYDVGIGDELYFPGLFTGHRGHRQLVPVMRQGTIAAMPDEPVSTELGPQRVHLAEARSIGGFSGSPVFLNMDTSRRWARMGDRVEIPSRHAFLGLVHGHYNRPSNLPDEVVNMGIALVVPAAQVREALTQPGMEVFMQQTERQPETGVPTMDDDAIAAADFDDVEVDTLGTTADLLGKLMAVPKDEAREG